MFKIRPLTQQHYAPPNPFVRGLMALARSCKLIGFLLLMSLPNFSAAQMGENNEAALKVAFLFNFFKFIDWPETDVTYYRLCLSSSDDLGNSLDVLTGKVIKNKPLQIVRNIAVKDLKTCHILFISPNDNVGSYLKDSKKLPIVTISDQSGFIDQGGTLGLIHDGTRLGFEVNLDAANTNAIRISAQLLKLAKTVTNSK